MRQLYRFLSTHEITDTYRAVLFAENGIVLHHAARGLAPLAIDDEGSHGHVEVGNDLGGGGGGHRVKSCGRGEGRRKTKTTEEKECKEYVYKYINIKY